MPAVDTFRPELIEDAKEAAWSSISSLFQFAGASVFTPLDRFGRLLPAYVMANSEDYGPDAISAFVDQFCKTKKPISTMVMRAEDKLGLTAVDYACFSPHIQESANFLRYIICMAVLLDEPVPTPNLERLSAVSFAADCFENLRRAQDIKFCVPRYLADSRNAVLQILNTDPECEGLCGTSIRGSSKDVSRRFRAADRAWRDLPIPDGDSVLFAPEEAEYLAGLNGDKPVEKRIRDVLVNHLSAIEGAPVSPALAPH